MDTSGFDTVARHIPLYRERLLALPAWVKDQAFDIHIASGQPLSLSGKEGALFLGKKGVTRAFQEGIVTTPQQLRELFLAACGHSVFRHEEELRQGYVRRGGRGRPGALPAGHNCLGVPHPAAGARLRGQALSGRRSLRARRAGGGAALQREDHLPPGRGPLPVLGAVRPQPPGGGGGRAGRAGRL